jgi:hypothetical protein
MHHQVLNGTKISNAVLACQQVGQMQLQVSTKNLQQLRRKGMAASQSCATAASSMNKLQWLTPDDATVVSSRIASCPKRLPADVTEYNFK